MKKALKIFLLFIISQIGGQIILSLPIMLVDKIKYGEINLLEIQNLTLPYLPWAQAILAFTFLYLGGYIKTSGIWEKPTAKQLSLYSGLGLLSIFVVSQLIEILFPNIPDTMKHQFEIILSSPMGFIGVTLIGPFIEELVFRCCIERLLLKEYKPIIAIFISAIIFGIVHINPIQVVGASVSGLILGTVYYKTNSIYPCLAIHIANNIIYALL